MSILQDKVAIVTGGASGIGASTAVLFAEQGAKVVLTDINESLGQAVADQINADGHEAVFLKADAGNAEDAERTVKVALETFGKLDIAVNNAGIAGHMGSITEFPNDAWQQVIDVNLSGVFYGLKFQLAAIEQTAGKGSIINVSSIMGAVATPYAAAYVAAKHGLIGLTKVAALESSAKGIRVNAIGPAYIETPILSSVTEEQMKGAAALHPIGRIGKPEEVAELLLWLASDKASFVTGSYYPIDGGYLAQ